MAFASARTVSDFISSMIPSVFAEARTTELRAAAAGRAVVVCAREDSRGRAVGQSLGRFVSRSVHRRARALKTRGGDEENFHRATSARPRVDRVARRVARTSRHAARARSGSRARRRPFAARVTLAANARGRSRARARERVVENGRTLETLLTNAGATCARDAVAETENIVQSL